MSQKNKSVDFKYSVVDKKICAATIDVKVSDNVVSNELEMIFSQIYRRAKIDGFRQGKVPMDIVRQKFAQKVRNEVIENIIKETILSILEREILKLIGAPIVEKIDYKLGQDLKYRFTVEFHPKVEVKDYKGIPITRKIYKITEQSLDKSLEALKERNAILKVSKSDKVTEQSFVLVDYCAFDSNGKIMQGISEKGHMLDMRGSENTLKGFRSALKGAKIGDEKDIIVEYPTGYQNKNLAGKTITFKTNIIEIKEKELPELNDDFAKDIGFETLENLKTKINEILNDEENLRQNIDIEKQIVDYLLDRNKFEVPQSLVVEQKKSLVNQMKEYMQSKGMTEEYIKKQVELGNEKFKEEAEKNIRFFYILNAICINENLNVSDADIEIEKNKMKTVNRRIDNEINKYFVTNERSIMTSLKEKKFFKFLIENAEITIEEKDRFYKKK
ncbi:MAG: trigger factor [Endomicrobium sp.]|jgi:trigger factor|nr:trigger factor [Endomicrobium sp.]